jgi:arylsulfatase A-like enzyme
MPLRFSPVSRWRASILGGLALLGLSAADTDRMPQPTSSLPPPRNVVIILADDFGWGSAGCYGATMVKTPNLDALAAQGIRLTDAHASSSVCSPSRYGIMTGRFFWRTTNDPEVLRSNAPFHAGLERTTIARLFQKAGYFTGAIGKWHLGLGTANKVDWNAPLKPGPLEAGFDYFYGMQANVDEAPAIYIENHSVVGKIPNSQIVVTGAGPTSVTTGVSDLRTRVGAGPRFASKACAFIDAHKDQPFFLYYAPNEVHQPNVPTPQFAGSTKLGVYGDFIQQLDYEVGQVLATLDQDGLAQDTLVIFTSDNGAVVAPGTGSPDFVLGQTDGPKFWARPDAQAQKLGFKANGPLRDGKHSVFEGGFRIPFIARWPGHIPAGVVSPAIINLADLTATAAALVHKPIPAGDAEDSFNILPVLLNQTTTTPGRDYTLSFSAHGLFGLRSDQWKYIEKGVAANVSAREFASAPPRENMFQLYDLSKDLGETTNLYDANRPLDAKLQADIDAARNDLRSHPKWEETDAMRNDPDN